MKSSLIYLLLLLMCASILTAQVGIGTQNPQGALDVVSENTGIVIPRVANVESVTNGQGGNPVNGTMVFDLSRNANCFYQNNRWVCITEDSNGVPQITPIGITVDISEIDYIKATNTQTEDNFGYANTLSGDGLVLAVSAPDEDSNGTGVNSGTESNNSKLSSGAVYIYRKVNDSWVYESYIKPSNTDQYDLFGYSIDLNYDGTTLAISATGEDSNGIGVNPNSQSDNSIIRTGAVYIFRYQSATWVQTDYIKSSSPDAYDDFGIDIRLSDDGNTLVVGIMYDDSNGVGVNSGAENDNSLDNSGAIYVFEYTTDWNQTAYIKAPNPDANDVFGRNVSLSADGKVIAVGTPLEDRASTGINGDLSDNSSPSSGAVYIYRKINGNWTYEAYIKPTVHDSADAFGSALDLNSNGNILVVSSPSDDSNGVGINSGSENDNSATGTGAVYLFQHNGSDWNQTAYIKAPNSDDNDYFGGIVKISGVGNIIAISSLNEDSNGTGIDPDAQFNNSSSASGAVYLYELVNGVLTFKNYLKAPNTNSNDQLGRSIDISYSGKNIVVGSLGESSNGTGVNPPTQSNNSMTRSGAAYVYSSP